MHDGTLGSFKAARKECVDIRVGVERRRRWSRGEKLRIVRESLAPNAVVTDVARRNEIAASLIYAWRRQALAGVMEGFHRVEVVSGSRGTDSADAPMVETQLAAPNAPLPDVRETALPAARETPTKAADPAARIEVTFPGGAVVRVDGAADVKALRAVLGVLVER